MYLIKAGMQNYHRSMRKIYIITVLTAGLFILNACKKDSEVFVPDAGQITGPDTNWYASITPLMPVNDLQTSLLLSPDIDSIDVSNAADTIHSASGLQCIFPAAGCVDSTGAAVNGKIYVQSFLLKNRGHFIAMGLPTASQGNPLVSGGAFSIQLQKGNSILQLAKDSFINISYADTAISQEMKLFNVYMPWSNMPFDWVQDTAKTNTIEPGNYSYNIKSNQLQWINCSRYYGDTTANNKTTLAVKLPPNLTNANTLAYVVVNNVRSVISMSGIAASKEFVATKIPAGLNVTIVTISKDGNFYYLGQQTTTTVMPAANPIAIVPARVTLDDIKNYLNTL